VVIPVVFHLILTQTQFNRIGGAEGIEHRVYSQIEVLNEDFNRMNADSTRIPDVFKPLYGNARIRFALAHRKPEGSGYVATPGYEVKILTGNDTLFNMQGGSRGSGLFCSDAKYDTHKGLPAWDPTKYLNVWVVRITDYNQEGVLGVATPPSFVSRYGIPINERGVVLTFGVLGRRRHFTDYFYQAPLDKGRTLVHEIGHYLELQHIWGNADGCQVDDGINDTPPQNTSNHGCPSFPKANCTNSNGGEMFMNFMDYVNDGCMHMFTHGQVAVMQQQVAQGGLSWPLTQNPELTWWPTDVATTTEAARSLTIAPNPATDRATIHAAADAGLKQVTLTDMAGRVVKSVSLQQPGEVVSMDLAGLNKGIYVVLCRFETETVSRKLILQ
jgi:hypothetical protein